MLAHTETWITSDAPDVDKNGFLPAGYSAVHVHRGSVKRGGGLAVAFHSLLQVTKLPTSNTASTSGFEVLGCSDPFKPKVTDTYVIYRPPSANRQLFDGFAELLASLAVKNHRFVICSDFNLPGPSSSSLDSELADLLDGLVQHVDVLTRCVARCESNSVGSRHHNLFDRHRPTQACV